MPSCRRSSGTFGARRLRESLVLSRPYAACAERGLPGTLNHVLERRVRRPGSSHTSGVESDGEMAEWSKAVDSKSTVPLRHRGFESLSLRHLRGLGKRPRRGARAAESARLESAWAPKVSRGFESHPLRFGIRPAHSGAWIETNKQRALRVLVAWTKGGRARWGGSGAL